MPGTPQDAPGQRATLRCRRSGVRGCTAAWCLVLRVKASPSCPPAARVVEPAGVRTRSPLPARSKKAPFRELRDGGARGGCTAALRALPLRGDGFAVVGVVEPVGVRTRSPLPARSKKAPFRESRNGGARGGCTAALRALPLRGDGCAVVSTRCAGGRTEGFEPKPLASPIRKKAPMKGAFLRIWRREGDSNPRSAV